VAFFKNRYAVRVYPVSASILVKEKEETSEGRLLYNNPLVSGFRNYLNEIYLIRSYPLVERTLKELNFGVSFYHQGNVLTSEAYGLPFIVTVLTPDAPDLSFLFKPLNADQFQLSSVSDNSDAKTYAFGDTITNKAFRMVVQIDSTARPVEENLEFILSYSSPKSLTGGYVSKLQAAWAEEGSGVMNLSINGSLPQKEIEFLNGLIKQYQLADLDKKNQAASRTLEFITDQLTGITDSLRHVERQLERFKDKNVMTGLSQEAERLYSKLEGVEAQQAELIIRNNYYKYLTEYLKESKNLDQIILPTSIGISDPIMGGLIQKMVDLQMQLKMNNRAENPIAAEAKRRINEIRQDIVESVKNQQSTDKIRQDYINKQVADIERQLNYLPVAERQLVSIQRNYSLLENLYIFLLQKKAEAGISKASTTTDIEMVNPPMISGGPISPQPTRNYVIAIIIGLGIPIGIFIAMELMNSRIQSKEDIEKVTAIPFIGGVGHKKGVENLEVFNHPKTAISESFRALRSNLNYFLGRHEKAVIMITSSISGEGKTFTSINLASVITLSGKKTLIIGADMRRPKIFADFGLSNQVGLSSYLAELSTFKDVVQQTSFPNLDLVSGGPVPPNPAELLMTSRMKQFIDEARVAYEYIIIDTPPMAIVTDAFVISEMVDHTLFLVRQNYTPKDLLRTIEDFYASGKVKNISLVLNDIYRSGPGYGYGYNYGYGYGYSYSNKNGYGYYS
jgi:capsular exopolysaccharide synthesis family protein